MNRGSFEAVLVLLMAMLCLSCQDAAEPQLTPEQTRDTVLGKWKIEKVESKLCRSSNCMFTTYTGNMNDTFEFKADSAFLSYYSTGSTFSNGAFKAEYTLAGAFILKQEFWSARYTLAEKKPGRITLICAYAGSDPYTKFTDIYYLYR